MDLVVKDISKIYNSKNKTNSSLNKINLSIKKGEFICIVGPSGCGKSTLLNIIAGLEGATSGQVSINGSQVTNPGPDKAVVFQDGALFPWLKVIDNVEFGMKMAGVPKGERREKALEYLRLVHLTKFQNSYMHELSGGMRQRVAIARALSLDSEILLMDEPFSALDSQTRNILQLELQQIWWKTKKTVIFVTHTVEEAVMLGDRVVVMTASPGKIKKEYTIQLSRPRFAENSDINYYTGEIKNELKDEVEKVAKNEFDSGWSIEKDTVLSGVDNTMGIGL
ncbi:ABC transporter ATP-binding protein [Herbivorax sp. ANBcel31]|uniref:ABC transporter ATP-binding protein n=1 Tax=Herbivorax sp. ANBcel31 TaxID=3069754 RepID=UPI0027ADC036|nr:ABC transporter ATP-binding protein [Herbivorax sp. ANBcel31]MDQ2085442.1 ABC transporter ATP-binding protein [Herbivorax sp. ANBcel31]